MSELLEFQYDSSQVLQLYGHGHGSRVPHTFELIKLGWQSIKQYLPPNKRWTCKVHVGDNFDASSNWSYGVPNGQSHWSVPSFVFSAWPEVGIHDYDQTFSQVLAASMKPATDERVFWIGNTSTHISRGQVHQLLAPHMRHLLDFRSMQWGPSGNAGGASSYVSLPDHAKYAALLDLPGVGFSGRLPLLLATGRPVIIAGRPAEQWFWYDMQPWVHYIPCGPKWGFDYAGNVGGFLFELKQQLLWVQSHQEEAAAIGRRGQAFALEHLTRTAAVKRIGNMLMNHAFPVASP